MMIRNWFSSINVAELAEAKVDNNYSAGAQLNHYIIGAYIHGSEYAVRLNVCKEVFQPVCTLPTPSLH